MLVIDIGFLNHLDSQPRDFIEAELDGGIEPDTGRDLLDDAGPEAVARDFIDFDVDRPVDKR